VVWSFASKSGVEHVDVAVKSGQDFFYTCTDQLGFFFVPAASQPTPNWLTAETHIRGELGETIMPADKEHKSSCDEADCHAHPEHKLWRRDAPRKSVRIPRGRRVQLRSLRRFLRHRLPV